MPDEQQLDVKSIEEAYRAAMFGAAEPQYMVCPEGAFLCNADGSITVFDFDAEGNHYELSFEEQAHRIEKLRARLVIADA